MEIQWRAGVGAYQQPHARLPQLPQLRAHRTHAAHAQAAAEVAETPRVLDGAPHVRPQVGRRQGTRPPVVAPVRPLDGQTLHHRLDHRRHHPGLPVHQALDDVGVDGGAVAGGQVQVLDAVLARPDPHQQIVAVAHVPGDPQPAPAGLRRDGAQLRFREPGVDLEDPRSLCDGGARRAAGLLHGANVHGMGAAVVALDLPVRPVRDPAHAGDDARPRNPAAFDASLRGGEGVGIARQIHRGGDAAQQELAGGDGHDVGIVRAVRAVPVLIVGVAEDVQVHVDVDQPRHDGHPAGVDDLGAVGRRQRLPAAGRDDAVVVDQDDAAGQGRSPVAVDEQAADDGQGGGFGLRIPLAVERLRRRRRRAGQDRDEGREEGVTPGASGWDHTRPPESHRLNLAAGVRRRPVVTKAVGTQGTRPGSRVR